ncbi:DUF1853 family protein [Planctomycetaceae bacterium SH139]
MNETEQFARDLVWVVNSPSLMNLTGQESVPKQPLKIGDVDREHLTIHLTSPRERRVGRYFERLVVYWLRFILRCEIVDHALQLRDGKRTAGEIDVLFRDGLGRLNHWELACKFYLQVNVNDPSVTDYIGPNVNDTLRKKAERLLNHQLPLGVRYFPEIDISEAFVKGRIFYHWQTNTKVALPEELAAGHLEGRWLRKREVAELLCTRRHRYRILRKPFWLSEEFADPADDDILSPGEVAQFLNNHFNSRHTPILFSEFCDSSSTERESKRWFVVPDQWPFQSERNGRQ